MGIIEPSHMGYKQRRNFQEREEEQVAWRERKKWSLESGCSCAAALLAEEFGRERSI